MNSRAISLTLLLAARLLAQTDTPVFRSESNLQSIAVQVTDKQGNPIQHLTASDFTLLENGRQQKIAFFGAEYQPMSLAVAIDASASMDADGKLDQARRFLGPLLRGKNPQDEILLMPFADKIGSFERLSAGQRLQPPMVEAGSIGSGGTALYDAVASALCHMRTAQNPRQAVVVITDGADQHSRLRLEQLIELARSSSAQIFTIGLYSKMEHEIYREREKFVTLASGRDIDNPVIVFERLAKESGAESFFPTSERDFKKALDRIEAVLEAQYTLAYYPASVDRLRRIAVKVDRSGAKVAARHSVGSEAGGEEVHFSATGCEVSPKDHPFPWEPRLTIGLPGTRTYHEDFSDPASGWPNRAGDQSRKLLEARTTARYVEGGFEISRTFSPAAPQARITEGVIAAYGPWWNNFRASIFMESKWDRAATSLNLSDSAAGMVFNVSPGGYYALLLASGERPDRRGQQIFYTLVRKDWARPPAALIPWTLTAAQEARGHKLSVEYNRGQIAVMIDGEPLGQIKESTFEGGQVGFGVFGNGRAVVRDLFVEELR